MHLLWKIVILSHSARYCFFPSSIRGMCRVPRVDEDTLEERKSGMEARVRRSLSDAMHFPNGPIDFVWCNN